MRIDVESLRVRFGTVTAVDGVSLPFAPGEVAVMAGPNGAGKSTLFSVLLGLVRPDAGRVLVDGRDVLGASRRDRMAFRARLGYLPEAVAFSENLTGRQVMKFFARARGVPKKRVEEVLEVVG
ncbi:MAG: ATP-binding cassette domain-containing protein, partial [Deltaproteobacteria bacterium]|nr:ATP-binding cassette domain-containing protein [Deltaproteobacteria bacterium]